jgi:acetylornithine deacetylase/succinyl-diaminopimelate desuccinylase-like protein
MANPVAAQTGTTQARPAVTAALDALRTDNAWTLRQQVELCQIPAPTNHEGRRAAEFRRRMQLIGYTATRLDEVGNVIAELPGVSPTGPRVVLGAHLDTVFPDSVDVTVTREGTRYRGPGIGDNCRGLAVLLAVARTLRQAELRAEGSIVFVATVGEEGLGNLIGVRHLVDRQSAGRIDQFIAVDGAGLGLVTSGVGSVRVEATVRGTGGHSYSAFGVPNPIHALGRAIGAISDIQVPVAPRTTFNVGVIHGGTSINSIAMSASMEVDMRSEHAAELDSLEAQVRRAVERAAVAEEDRWPGGRARLTVEWKELGRRPAAAQADTLPIIRAALATARSLGFNPVPAASSTDANYPMSLGIPSVGLDAGGTGARSHTTAEWYDDGRDGWRGAQWVLLLALQLAGLPN